MPDLSDPDTDIEELFKEFIKWREATTWASGFPPQPQNEFSTLIIADWLEQKQKRHNY